MPPASQRLGDWAPRCEACAGLPATRLAPTLRPGRLTISSGSVFPMGPAGASANSARRVPVPAPPGNWKPLAAAGRLLVGPAQPRRLGQRPRGGPAHPAHAFSPERDAAGFLRPRPTRRKALSPARVSPRPPLGWFSFDNTKAKARETGRGGAGEPRSGGWVRGRVGKSRARPHPRTPGKTLGGAWVSPHACGVQAGGGSAGELRPRLWVRRGLT